MDHIKKIPHELLTAYFLRTAFIVYGETEAAKTFQST